MFVGKSCAALLGGGVDKKDFNRCVICAMLAAHAGQSANENSINEDLPQD